MPRPSSIIAFDRLYLGSIAVYVLNAILFWSRTRDIMLTSPQVAANPGVAGMVPTIMIALLALTVAVSLLFWWLVARERSVVGKWLVIVTETIGALVGLYTLVRLIGGTSASTANIVLGLIATALAVAAAAMLLRGDANAWFGADEGEPVI